MNVKQITSSSRNKVLPNDSNLSKQKNSLTLICFSHLRWDFVYQRPQHLMSRFASIYNILYMEEPIYTETTRPCLSIKNIKKNLQVIIPNIPNSFSKKQENNALEHLLKEFIATNRHIIQIAWYYTPMMLQWSNSLFSEVIVYDCMDELSAFKFAPPELKLYEQELLEYADLIFTGGASLYKAKSPYHENVYLFPSSVDIEHFKKARDNLICPNDQIGISIPRIGFYGVIDERFDIKLLYSLANTKADWNFIIIGPVVKIDVNELPQLPNIHYLGSKSYDELPYYLSSWDVAFIPFAINESTKFISPTKTPEYLAGGRVVVSTPIIDIINTYGDSELVYIANPNNISDFTLAIESALEISKKRKFIYEQADIILNNMSWDKTFKDMNNLIFSIKKDKKVI